MTPLRQRMIEDLRLRGYAERTVEAYTRAVAHLARFFDQSPDQLTEEQVRDYFVHLASVKKVARAHVPSEMSTVPFAPIAASVHLPDATHRAHHRSPDLPLWQPGAGPLDVVPGPWIDAGIRLGIVNNDLDGFSGPRPHLGRAWLRPAQVWFSTN